MVIKLFFSVQGNIKRVLHNSSGQNDTNQNSTHNDSNNRENVENTTHGSSFDPPRTPGLQNTHVLVLILTYWVVNVSINAMIYTEECWQ